MPVLIVLHRDGKMEVEYRSNEFFRTQFIEYCKVFADSELKPASIPINIRPRSDLKPATIPINYRPVFGSDDTPWVSNFGIKPP